MNKNNKWIYTLFGLFCSTKASRMLGKWFTTELKSQPFLFYFEKVLPKLSRVALNFQSPCLSLLSSWVYRHAPPVPLKVFFFKKMLFEKCQASLHFEFEGRDSHRFLYWSRFSYGKDKGSCKAEEHLDVSGSHASNQRSSFMCRGPPCPQGLFLSGAETMLLASGKTEA